MMLSEHGFHESCIFERLRLSRLCPLYRFELPTKTDDEESDTEEEDGVGQDDIDQLEAWLRILFPIRVSRPDRAPVGLWFPCSRFVGDVLALFGLEIQQVLPNTITRLACLEWTFRMEGCEPHAKAFAATHLAFQREHSCPGDPSMVSNYLTITLRPRRERDVPAKGSRQHWRKQISSGWFYYNVGTKSNLHSRNAEILYIPKHVIPDTSALTTRIQLLSRIAGRLSMRDLVEEFCTAGIDPLRPNNWHVQFIIRDPASGNLQFARELLLKINFAEIEQKVNHDLGPLIQKE
ncbi:hypothetical protein PR202_gb00572 [Eleusine coracana subsp. coracana]|uniref:Uncharacterized protein n=1 Tax=Eleusine coracana subsp. coracana TaxID=191504 RepID=A0AAV5DV70_ELECO|nr:hypothetical protein PR202_gb00572 [Eleusine coracana subsp. coracana]